MHYKNGREAKNGYKIVNLSPYGPPTIGILYDATVGNDTCNGRLARISVTDPCPNLQDCLHLSDVLAMIPSPADVPDTSQPGNAATGQTAS